MYIFFSNFEKWYIYIHFFSKLFRQMSLTFFCFYSVFLLSCCFLSLIFLIFFHCFFLACFYLVIFCITWMRNIFLSYSIFHMPNSSALNILLWQSWRMYYSKNKFWLWFKVFRQTLANWTLDKKVFYICLLQELTLILN